MNVNNQMSFLNAINFIYKAHQVITSLSSLKDIGDKNFIADVF